MSLYVDIWSGFSPRWTVYFVLITLEKRVILRCFEYGRVLLT